MEQQGTYLKCSPILLNEHIYNHNHSTTHSKKTHHTIIKTEVKASKFSKMTDLYQTQSLLQIKGYRFKSTLISVPSLLTLVSNTQPSGISKGLYLGAIAEKNANPTNCTLCAAQEPNERLFDQWWCNINEAAKPNMAGKVRIRENWVGNQVVPFLERRRNV